jgi:methyl-accepting chemotaxis protein
VFRLPHDLLYFGNVPNVSLATTVFLKLAIAVLVTFLLGLAALASVIQVRRETVVYIEKKKSVENSVESQIGNNQEDSFDVDTIKKAIEVNGGEAVQQGLNAICEAVQAGQGAVFVSRIDKGKRVVELSHGYALVIAETPPQFEFGEGLVGQVAASVKSVYIDEVPEGYITIVSGLGTSSPRFLFLVPLANGKELKGVLEIATFQPLSEIKRKGIEEAAASLAQRIQ